jgi:hypothetical protein
MFRSDRFISSALQGAAVDVIRRQYKSILYVWPIPAFSSPLNRVYAILFVKTNQYNAILTNIFPQL